MLNRGEIFELPAPREARGHEQQGRRYGVVIQSDELRGHSTTIVAPTSTRVAATSFRPEIELLGERTRVVAEQLRAIDTRRLGDSVGFLAHDDLRAVERAVRIVLAL